MAGRSEIGVLKRCLAVAVLLTACSIVSAQHGRLEALREKLQTVEGAERVRVLNELAKATQGNAPDESIDHARRALALARSIGDREGEIRSLNNIGIGHYYLAEYDLALEAYTRSLELAETIGFEDGIADALNNTGIVYYVWGEYDRALEHYERALEIRRRTDDRMGLAKGYNNLANVYYAAERYEESLRHLSEALAVYEAMGEEGLAARTLDNIGLAEFKQGRFDDALGRFEQALAIAERLGDKPAIALSLNNIGMVYEEWERDREALDAYRRSLSVRQEIGDRQGVAICLHNIGVIHAGLGDLDAAFEYFERALAVATDIKLREIERDIHLAMSETYEQIGEPARALESYKLYKQVNDGLFDERASRQLSELETRYAVERKDGEIEILRANQRIHRLVRNVSLGGAFLLLCVVVLLYNRYRLKARANREIQKTNEALRVAQEQRERASRAELAHVARVSTMGELATALAHELNQPLTAIVSNAQATRRFLRTGRADRSELDDALGDIVGGANRAREIIQRLRRLIRRGEMTTETLDINETLRDIEPFARAAADDKGIVLELELEPGLPKVRGDRVQLQQVVLNLVHNGTEAMTGGSGERGRLSIRTSLGEDGAVVAAVVDSGPAVPDGVVDTMFEPFYTTKSEGLGMGLPICRTIIEAHGGLLWATPNPERGLTVQFSLPAAGAGPSSDALVRRR